MEKKFKFSEQPRKVKIIYGAVVAILCVTAIVIGIVSAASRRNDAIVDNPSDSTVNNPTDDGANNGGENDGDGVKEEDKEPTKLSFVSPVVGEVTKGHSLDMPVFSNTLNEWRVHTGIDISAEEGSEVYSAEAGTVTKVYSDPFLGKTVEITHEGGIVSVYANLSNTELTVKEGDKVKSGALIGVVGDTSLSELADESHLHFAMRVNGVSVNPLDYISESSKKASLGMTEI